MNTEPTNETQEDSPELAQLRALRAKRAELQRAREELQESQDIKEQIDAEERAIRTEEALAKAISEHGPVGRMIETVETDLGTIIVRRCSTLKFRRFQDEEKSTVESITALVRPCVLHPSGPEFDSMLEEQPAILMRVMAAVSRLAGVRSDLTAKK